MTEEKIRWIGGTSAVRSDLLPDNPLIMQVTGTNQPPPEGGERFSLTIAMMLPSGGEPVGTHHHGTFLAVQHTDLSEILDLRGASAAIAQAVVAFLIRVRVPLSEADPWPEIDNEMRNWLPWHRPYMTDLRRQLESFARRVIQEPAGSSISESWAFRQNSSFFLFGASLMRWLFRMVDGTELTEWEALESLRRWAVTTPHAEDYLYEIGLLQQDAT